MAIKTWKNPAWHPQTVPFLLPVPLQHHLLLQCTRLSFQTSALFFQNSSLSLSNTREDTFFLSGHTPQAELIFRYRTWSYHLTELAATFFAFFSNWNQTGSSSSISWQVQALALSAKDLQVLPVFCELCDCDALLRPPASRLLWPSWHSVSRALFCSFWVQ